MSSSAQGENGSRIESICGRIRARILDGTLPPGQRLPKRTDLEAEFGASSATLQRAFDRLVEDGFVETRPRQGSFVAARPPHLFRYAVAIPVGVRGNLWNRYWQALQNAAEAITRETDRRVELYTGVDRNVRDEDLDRLVLDIERHRLAGIVFAHSPFPAAGTPVLDTPGLPRVVLMGSSDPAMPVVGFSPIRERALDLLAERGRRRIAMITLPWTSAEHVEAFRQCVTEHGMETRTAWIQAVDLRTPRWVRHAVELLLDGPPAETPDAIFLTDDNLIEAACTSLAAQPVRTPADLDLVSHACLPAPVPGAWPVHTVGYDIREALETAIELIDAQRRGDPIPPVTTLPARLAPRRADPAPPNDPFAAYVDLGAPPHPGS